MLFRMFRRKDEYEDYKFEWFVVGTMFCPTETVRLEIKVQCAQIEQTIAKLRSNGFDIVKAEARRVKP